MRIDDVASPTRSFAQTAHSALALQSTPPLATAATAPRVEAQADSGLPQGQTLGALRRDGTAGAFLWAARNEPGPITPAQTQVDGYRVGAPSEPTVQFDEDFVYNSASPTRDDFFSAAEWRAKLAGAQLLRPDLGDATRAYAHYWGNSGDTLRVDYVRAFQTDTGVRANVNAEVARTAAAVDAMAAGQGTGTFSVTGQVHRAGSYPVTENWQKAIGGYQQWSSADVTVKGNQVSMTVTVHMMDRYNFNRGQADIASGAPDNANGRFTELGWARPFDTRGDITRTVTWTVGHPPTAAEVSAQLTR